jgi:NhaP-type Na+/H+ or K+/H+ antiporter
MKIDHVDSENTKSPRERRFEIWVGIIGGIYLLSALAVVLFVPHKIRGDIFIPFFLLLCTAIVYKNRRLAEIRQEEQTR